jgi:hypothetical protein
LLVEAETLDFREIQAGELGGDVVGRETYDRVVFFIVDFVEHDGRLGGVHVHLGL